MVCSIQNHHKSPFFLSSFNGCTSPQVRLVVLAQGPLASGLAVRPDLRCQKVHLKSHHKVHFPAMWLSMDWSEGKYTAILIVLGVLAKYLPKRNVFHCFRMFFGQPLGVSISVDCIRFMPGEGCFWATWWMDYMDSLWFQHSNGQSPLI
jgi:hypothetical protein